MKFQKILLTTLFSLIYLNVQATPSILGTFTGMETWTDFSCTDPSNNGSGSDPTTLVFSSQDALGNFSGINDGTTITGTIISDEIFTGTFSGPADGGGTESGTFAGQLTGNTLVLAFFGSVTGGSGCSFSGGLVASRGSSVITDNSAGTIATTPAVLQSQITAISSSTSVRTQDALQGMMARPQRIENGFLLQSDTGLAAGDGFAGFGVWGSYSRSDFDNDFALTAYDGERDMFMVGIDTSPLANTILGVAFGYESSDIDTTFNSGNQDVDGFTISPYFGAILSDTWNIDVSMGYSSVNTDQFRMASGATINSSVDADRWFWTSNLNGYMAVGQKWLLSGQIGFLYAREYQDSFTESDGTVVGDRVVKLGQWHIGTEAAYSYGDWEPYGRVSYQNDYAMTKISVAAVGAQPANDDDDVLVGAGVRYFGNNGLTGSFEWNKRLAREDISEDMFNLTLRMDY